MPALNIFNRGETEGEVSARPVLELSGPRLRQSFERLLNNAEEHGGVEAYIQGIGFKASVFQEALSEKNLPDLDEKTFIGLCAFIAPVRRRIGKWMKGSDITAVRNRIQALLGDATDGADTDARIQAFCATFPDGGKYRWVRDLAAELLHWTNPEQYPLMTRWVWDLKANTGVIREIWHAPDIDHMSLDVPNTYETFLVLREELSQFLADNGVFRDMLFYVDLLTAQIYADYICEQGGTYLKTDFSSEIDPMEYTRRMLGLDGVDVESGRTRMKLPDGGRYTMPELVDC
ncbi:MAG: hypothetical protein HN877_12440 [Rhodospirillaceae bacterium]|jgi:hypothetical protein|nr:hypothetical protein [Rhodospirillaceae bacterium]